MPKQLFPVVDKPLIFRTIENLKRFGVDEIILAVNYKTELLMERVGGEYNGIKVRYSREINPLGTGGPIKKAEPMLKGEDLFLCLNGDILIQNGLEDLIRIHRERNPVATITLREVEDPSRFGVAVLDDKMHIRDFIEKPNKGEVESRYINAGIYVLSSKIFDYIPKGRGVSTEHEVFPVLAREGKLLGYIYSGIWFDVGKIEDYQKANRFLLEKSFINKKFKAGFKTHPPYHIGLSCEIGDRSKIGPYSIVGSRSVIGENVKIENSILFDSVKVGNSTGINDAVLGGKVELGKNVVVRGGVVLAEGVRVLDGVNIIGKVNVCPYLTVKEDLKGPLNVLCDS
jgi:NDP-sugar pyrophosphorylase family protein